MKFISAMQHKFVILRCFNYELFARHFELVFKRHYVALKNLRFKFLMHASGVYRKG